MKEEEKKNQMHFKKYEQCKETYVDAEFQHDQKVINDFNSIAVVSTIPLMIFSTVRF